MTRVTAALVVTLTLIAGGLAGSPAARAATGPVVSLGSVRAVEGTTPLIPNAVKVPITLSEPQPTDVLVTWTVSGGTATAGTDYKAITKPKTAKIKAGKVHGFASLTLYGDSAVEGDETVQVTITNVVGASIGTGTNRVTIVEDPAGPPAVSFGAVSAVEGDTPSVAAAVTVPITLSASVGVDVLVTWSASGGTASAGTDYKTIAKPKTTKIKAGKTRGNATVQLLGDTAGEGDETIVLTITGVVGATVSGATGTITIVDDDTAVVQNHLWTWGSGSVGQLGNGGTIDQSEPAVAGIGVPTQWSDASAGFAHTCALNLDGTIWCTGDNYWGELGDGTTTNRTHLTQIGLATNWRTISAGGGHTCGTHDDQTAWCWGRNDQSQLGDGTTDEQHEPTQLGTDTDWVSVQAGKGLNTCGIKGNGTLWCWGDNAQGQLGDGTTTNSDTPTQVALGGRWLSVSLGLDHTCGLREDDNDPSLAGLWCWGYNGFGQLGDGTTTNRSLPTQVGSDLDWTSYGVSGGAYHTCALKLNRTMWCWGRNFSGELGDGTTTDRSVPTQVGTDTDWTDIAAGASYSCAVRYNATLWCWGWNAFGQLGDASFTDRLEPVQTSGTPPMLRVSANLHTVALSIQ